MYSFGFAKSRGTFMIHFGGLHNKDYTLFGASGMLQEGRHDNPSNGRYDFDRLCRNCARLSSPPLSSPCMPLTPWRFVDDCRCMESGPNCRDPTL